MEMVENCEPVSSSLGSCQWASWLVNSLQWLQTQWERFEIFYWFVTLREEDYKC